MQPSKKIRPQKIRSQRAALVEEGDVLLGLEEGDVEPEPRKTSPKHLKDGPGEEEG